MKIKRAKYNSAVAISHGAAYKAPSTSHSRPPEGYDDFEPLLLLSV